MKKPETLCFHCDQFFCSWRQYARPVDGWKAVPTKIKSGKQYADSCIVFRCPKFQRKQGYANDAEWDRIQKAMLQKRCAGSVYEALAEINSLCISVEPYIYGKIREEILRVQELHEAEILKLETQISTLRAQISRISSKDTEVPHDLDETT